MFGQFFLFQAIDIQHVTLYLKHQLMLVKNNNMKKTNWIFVVILLITTFAFAQKSKEEVGVQIDLNNVQNDRVMVTVTPPKIKDNEIKYYIPKIVPGTYSVDNYGTFIEEFKAFDKKGNKLEVVKSDENSWKISDAKKLAKVTYWVNDTYDVEDTHDIFSPSGTNILAGENFVINTHGFVGYFSDKKELPYRVEILKSESLYGATALIDLDASNAKDVFLVSRYAELVDNPMMYSAPDYVSFMVDDMEIILAVYSPNKVITSKDLAADMEKMMQAQKKFLGKINDTKKYAILLYMSDMQKPDANGFGALEHSTSTVVVFTEAMDIATLKQSMIDVVSHEFFHIVTPLSIHSEEIHYFDFNSPKMSQHLWMYEGVTEYFANLFQINQGLIDENDYYERIARKVMQAKNFDDKMPFTKMSASVLAKPYKDNYLNVYEKGALIAMCLDIELRHLSQGKMGILDLMQKLSEKYGINKPFKDADLFNDIVALTFPEIRTFLDTYVAGPTPIPYEDFLAKVGVAFTAMEVPGNLFFEGQTPFVTIDRTTKEIVLLKGATLPEFYAKAGLKGGDFLLSFNDKNYNLDNIYDLINESMTWKDGDPIKISFRTEETKEVKTIETTVLLPKMKVEGLMANPEEKTALRNAWLKE